MAGGGAYCGFLCHLLPLWTLLCLGLLLPATMVLGNPCTNGTHTCDVDTQKCVGVANSSTNFTCECVKDYQQMDSALNCTDLPDSQKLYITTLINTSLADIFLVHEILQDESYTENILKILYQPLTALPAYKGIQFLEYRIGPVEDLRMAVYALLFMENVTSQIRQTVALAALGVEQKRVIVTSNNLTVIIAGYTGIFDTEEGTRTQEDDVDWCSSPLLYTCRTNSTCRDLNLRYNCPCKEGFVDDGTSCYVCDDDFSYGPDCELICDCVINNTMACDHANGTCLCKEFWEGQRCGSDVNECARNDDVCGDPAFHQCINVLEGYQCACAEGILEDEASGECRGAAIKAPSPFETDGNRDLHLVCQVSNETEEVTQYDWSEECLQKEGARCTIRPQPPWDDEKKVTCSAHFASGQSFTASLVVELNYPPHFAPVIEGYQTGQNLPAGDTLKMTCTVTGGKPPASAVLFSCPRHPDVTPDINGTSDVSSVLSWRLKREDNGTLCTCSALWKQGEWYTQSATRLLSVTEQEGTGGNALDFKWYIIFSALGVFFIVLIVLAVVVCRRQAQNKSSASATPSTENTSAGTSTAKGQPTGMGSDQASRDQLSSLESGYNSTNPEQYLGAPPPKHVWRRVPWQIPSRSGSADDVSQWNMDILSRRANSRRHNRRNSVGGGGGDGDDASYDHYDYIGRQKGGDYVLSGQSSDMYLHPRNLPPALRPLPDPLSLQAGQGYSDGARSTGTRQERFFQRGTGSSHRYLDLVY